MLFELLDKHLSNEVLGLGPQGGIQSRIQYILTNSFRQLSSRPSLSHSLPPGEMN